MRVVKSPLLGPRTSARVGKLPYSARHLQTQPPRAAKTNVATPRNPTNVVWPRLGTFSVSPTCLKRVLGLYSQPGQRSSLRKRLPRDSRRAGADHAAMHMDSKEIEIMQRPRQSYKALAAEQWFGYGRWAAPYWFVGMEPGGQDDARVSWRCSASTKPGSPATVSRRGSPSKMYPDRSEPRGPGQRPGADVRPM
jgi:hypothetical protein